MTTELLLRHVSTRVREARQAHGWSQQTLAERAGVSRRMLAAIEGEESNVSLATLGRIAAALEIAFAELVREPSAPGKRGAGPQVVAWKGKSPESQAVLLLSAEARRNVELWQWSLAPGERYQAEADPPGMREFLYVVEGTLTLIRGRRRKRLTAGEAVAFPTDQPYAYLNAGRGVLRFTKNVLG